MSKIFIGGSRSIHTLKPAAESWLQHLIYSNDDVLVGDAAGVDFAVQSYFASKKYNKVTVYFTSMTVNSLDAPKPRHCVGHVTVKQIEPPPGVLPPNRAFFTAKDKAMAQDASAGIMIWDGESIGTLMNVYRLAKLLKPCLLTTPFQVHVISTFDDWREFAKTLPLRIVEQVERDK